MEKSSLKFNDLLVAAIKTEGAVKGILQRYRREINELEIIASQGFTPEYLSHYKGVKPFDLSCYGRALGVGSPILISDTEKEILFSPSIAVARAEGFRAIKSVPIFDSNEQKIGVLSIHFKEPKWDWNTCKIGDIIKELAKALETDTRPSGTRGGNLPHYYNN